MKNIKYALLFAIIMIFNSLSGQENLDQVVIRQQLVEKMYNFFMETLKENYKSNSDYELYEKFLSDYFNRWITHTENSQLNSILKIDRSKLDAINKLLFIRDNNHYYYLYPEVILLKDNQDFQQVPIDEYKAKNVEVLLIKPGKTLNNNGLSIMDISKIHGVTLAFKSDYYLKYKQNSNSIFQNAQKLGLSNGEITYFNFVASIIKTDAIEDLKQQSSQELIAIVFWKFLCLQGGVDFYDL